MYNAPYRKQWFEFALSDNGAAPSVITAGIKFVDRWPALAIVDLRASVITASTLNNVTIDLLVNGVSILATPLTIVANVKTSFNGAVPFVFTSQAARIVPDDAEITWQILNAGTNAAGLTARAQVQF